MFCIIFFHLHVVHTFLFLFFFLTRKFHRSPFAGRCFFWILTFLAFSKVSPVRLVEFYSKRVFLFLFFLSEKSFFLFTSWLCRSMPKIFYPNENFSCIHCVDFKKDVALKEVVGSLKSRKLRFFYLCFWCRKFYALFFKGILMSSRKSLKVHMYTHCMLLCSHRIISFLHNVFSSFFWRKWLVEFTSFSYKQKSLLWLK